MPTQRTVKSPKRTGKVSRSKARKAVKAVRAPAGREETVSIRKISNGFIVTRSNFVGGEFRSTDTFSAKKPTVKIG